MLTTSQVKLALTLTASALLLIGCGCDSPLLKPTQGPLIPPLPAQARQPATPPECLPTCSASVSIALDSWLASPTSVASQARPASGAMTR